MTEAPKVGFLCTGKTPLELAISIHCQSKMSTVFTNAGYHVGGCYTEIFDNSGPEKIKRAGKTLEYLCRSNEVVLTLGCEGFDPGDVIPELTAVVCTGSASYFTSVLCGAKELPAVSDTDTLSAFPSRHTTHSRCCERLYSDDMQDFGGANAFRPRTLHRNDAQADSMPFAEKLRRALHKINRENLPIEPPALDGFSADASAASSEAPSRMTSGSAIRIFAGIHDHKAPRQNGQTKTDHANPNHLSPSSGHTARANVIKIPPSRAHAGLLDKALLLNFSNDVDGSLPLLSALLPAIGFSVFNLSGKSAASYAEFEKRLRKSAGIDDFSKTKQAVNG